MTLTSIVFWLCFWFFVLPVVMSGIMLGINLWIWAINVAGSTIRVARMNYAEFKGEDTDERASDMAVAFQEWQASKNKPKRGRPKGSKNKPKK